MKGCHSSVLSIFLGSQCLGGFAVICGRNSIKSIQLANNQLFMDVGYVGLTTLCHCQLLINVLLSVIF